MAEELTLGTVLSGWEGYQQLLVEAIAPLTTAQLALRAAPGLCPVWLLAAHIASCRVGWFQQLMGEGDPALGEIHEWDVDGAAPRSAAELVTALTATWEMVSGCLARWGPEMLGDRFERPGRPARTRGWVVWHVLEHDIHHGGELSLTLGAHGLRGLEL